MKRKAPARYVYIGKPAKERRKRSGSNPIKNRMGSPTITKPDIKKISDIGFDNGIFVRLMDNKITNNIKRIFAPT